MLVLRYKTLVDFPGVPAGEILEQTTAQQRGAYRSKTYPNFWVADQVVETQDSKFALDQVITGTVGNFSVVWSAAADQTIAYRQSLKTGMQDLQAAITALTAKL